MNIGIDHGYYAIETQHFSFPAGIAVYSHEPYTLQNTLEYGGKFFVCGTGRQPILRNKMENDNYFLLTLAAIARGDPAARKRANLFRNSRRRTASGRFWPGEKALPGVPSAFFPACVLQIRGTPYKITIEDVKLFPTRVFCHRYPSGAHPE